MTDRAVSVTVNYVLGLAVTALLITGLLYATGDVVGDRRDAALRGELRVVGEQVAADLVAADRLAQTGASEVVVHASGPDRIGGQRYSVSIDAAAGEVVVETLDPDVQVRVPFRNTTPVTTSQATGGRVRIVLVDAGGAGESLEVRTGG